MDNLTFKTVALDGGLNLTAAKIVTEGGTLQDNLNYEIVDRSGYKRIDGFEPFDGENTLELTADDELADLSVSAINTLRSTARATVTALETQPVGAHWFRDRLYAVAEDIVVRFSNTAACTADETPQVGQYISNGTIHGRILKIEILSGTFAAGTAVGFMWVENLGSDYAWATPATGFDTYLTYTPPATFTNSVKVNVLDTVTFSGIPTLESASIWQARSAAQATEESASDGWSRIDLGWTIDYENGFSDSGELQKIEKGVTPNFSAPTPVTAAAATYGSLVQGMTVTSEIGQAQGWKASDAETVWATTPTSVNTDDTTYLYGDAFARCSNVITYAPGGYTFPVGQVFTEDASGGTGELPGTSATKSYNPAGNGSTVFSWVAPSVYSTTFQGSNGYSYFVLKGINGITSLIPEGARITGIQVDAKYDAEVLFYGDDPTTDNQIFGGFTGVRLEGQLMTRDAGTSAYTKLGSAKNNNLDFTQANFTISHDATAGGYRSVRWTKNAESTSSFGGTTDLWGNSSITRTQLTSADFSLGLRLRVDCGTISGRASVDNYLIYRPLIDYVTVTVTYVIDSVHYYFTDGTSVIEGDLVYYSTVSGDFRLGSAAGELQLINVARVSGPKSYIDGSMTMHTNTPTSAGNKVADIGEVSATIMSYNGLPGLLGLEENASRYEFITANFYALDNQDGFYGVSGAGPAFSVNTYDDGSNEIPYFVKIVSNDLDTTTDKPRHVAYHHNALALGFLSGEVRLSVIGEPENFSGEDGAASIAVGDKITGLLSMRGATLGVFCDNSIHGIVGTDFENYTTQVLSPTTGCVEYTAVDMGVPIYCDSKGITTLSQSEKYGDFLGTRLSAAITPWILPRFRRRKTAVDGDKTIVCAVPIRHKNQYRVFFKDGYILTMTLVGGELQPQFTFQKYFLNASDLDYEGANYIIPLAYSAQSDQTGQDRIHFCVDGSNYMYEMDVGWSFAGKGIPAFFTTNWIYNDPPVNFSNLMKLSLSGLSYGSSNINVQAASDLQDNYTSRSCEINIPRNSESTVRKDWVPYDNINSINQRGRCFSLKFTNDIANVNSPEPSHICQVLIIGQTSPGAGYL